MGICRFLLIYSGNKRKGKYQVVCWFRKHLDFHEMKYAFYNTHKFKQNTYDNSFLPVAIPLFSPIVSIASKKIDTLHNRKTIEINENCNYVML